jgi:hypothetical protein
MICRKTRAHFIQCEYRLFYSPKPSTQEHCYFQNQKPLIPDLSNHQKMWKIKLSLLHFIHHHCSVAFASFFLYLHLVF